VDKPQISKNKLQIKLKYQIPMSNKTILSVILFENLKIGFWKLLVIWDLIFVISNSAKK